MKNSSARSAIAMVAVVSTPALFHPASAAEPQQGMKMNMPAPQSKEMSCHAKVVSFDPVKEGPTFVITSIQ